MAADNRRIDWAEYIEAPPPLPFLLYSNLLKC